MPFKIENGIRVGDTPVHRAIREVLANCLVNTDFYIPRGVVIKLEKDVLTIENPGAIRVGKYQMRLGGQSDPRNKALMKMFNLIGVGERAGSGVPELFSVWENEGWVEPIIEEKFDPDRTLLTMQFVKKVPEKSARKKVPEKSARNFSDKKVTKKTQMQYDKILNFMKDDTWYKASDFMAVLDVKDRRIKVLLNELVKSKFVVEDGSTKGRRYKKKT
ncbi:ATP-binding protein [Amedibacterium intestinale]|uniref:ATP-binding protein n=1 Tax=Amedibacterium intestinale TaxID=2583452 RepID=UPI0018F4D770|nr:ATP-binding protein [Amedibacterium intestinale]